MSEQISAKIKKIGELLPLELRIPEYQRPYIWDEENVRQLLQDIYTNWKEGKKSYRIGTIILHPSDGNSLDIVDGQQRITTLVLILKTIDSNSILPLAEKLRVNHIDSINSIISNQKSIERWIYENIYFEKKDFKDFILHQCEIVEVNVTQLSEAFQMFDSQNGRGKELEAYNLLKAFHIRAMENEGQNVKIKCDQEWEQAARYFHRQSQQKGFDILRQLFSEQLYRTRVWSRKEKCGNFDRKKLGEFKGINCSPNATASFPFQNKEHLFQYLLEKYGNGSEVIEILIPKFKRVGNQTNFINDSIQINENIVNGKHFFRYVGEYSEMYIQLFLATNPSNLAWFHLFYQENCMNYDGAYRDGDCYLRELYKSLIFLVFDRFGEGGIRRFHNILYLFVYRLRLEKKHVRYDAVADYPVQKGAFQIISIAKSYADFRKIEQWAYSPINCRKKVEHLLRKFAQMGIELYSQDNDVNLNEYKIS